MQHIGLLKLLKSILESGESVLGGKGVAHRQSREKKQEYLYFCFITFSDTANFPLANPGTSLSPCLDEPCFQHVSLLLLPPLHRDMASLFQRDSLCSTDMFLSPSVLCLSES